MTRAIGYIRRSTENQHESLEQQREKLEAFARTRGWELIKLYAYDAVSGSDLHRAGLEQLLSAAASCDDVDVVVAWDRNRLARLKDPVDGMLLERKLIEAGKRVVYAANGQEVDRSFASGLIGYVEHYQNGDYLRKLSRDTMRGLVARARRGLQRRIGVLDQHLAKLRDHLKALDAATAESLGLYAEAKQVSGERAAVERRLNDLPGTPAELPGVEQVRALASVAFEQLETVLEGGSIEEKRNLIGLYVKCIEADRDQQTVEISLYPALFSREIAGARFDDWASYGSHTYGGVFDVGQGGAPRAWVLAIPCTRRSALRLPLAGRNGSRMHDLRCLC